MKFARRVYLIAAIYGLIVLVPQYFMEGKNGRDFPPAITPSTTTASSASRWRGRSRSW